MQNADTWYLRRPWDSMPEARLSATLGAFAATPPEEIAALRPPLPQVRPFPPRFGYEQRPLTVTDCFALGHNYPTAMDDPTRVQPGYSGSSVTSMNGV